MANKTEVFEIGLCMAGAVSAGAYTAGVMDYLLEALEEWEKRRGQEDTPKHKVVIKVIGGASAGGMTGIITASAINNPIQPVRRLDPKNIMAKQAFNKFYHTWVDQVQNDMFPLLLNTDDIKGSNIYSLLNSSFLDTIAERGLQVDKDNWVEKPYIDNNMKFFTTLTNLKGFKYAVTFNGNQTNNEYIIKRHSDYGTFILNKSNNEYDDDGWIPVDFRNEVNIELAKNSALATGAFPIGLRARKVNRDKKYVNQHIWNKDFTENEPITENPYEMLFVDGGMINNEPFEKFDKLLNSRTKDYNTCYSTILMIDPFPSEDAPFNLEENGLFSVVGKTFSAMMNQMRIKPEVIKDNLSVENISQFQIAPTRKVNGIKKFGKKAIACGFLGGFGGFIHKEFRIHDYFLGRANCEKFLRHYFTIPKDAKNEIFEYGYDGVSGKKYLSFDEKRQIIPIFTGETNNKYIPVFENGTDWPIRQKKDIDRFKPLIKQRAGKIIMNLTEYNWLLRSIISAFNWLFIKRKIAKSILGIIHKELKDEWKLMK